MGLSFVGLRDSGALQERLWASVASVSPALSLSGYLILLPALGFAITAIARSTLF